MEILKTHEMIPCDNDQIWCNIYAPVNYKEKKSKTIILSHGYNGFSDSWDLEGSFLAEEGIVVYALDFCGASLRSRSTGDRCDMTISSEKKNLIAVIDYLKKQSFVDSSNLYLLGESQGGFISALVAEEKKEEIQRLFLYFPALCIPDNWREKYPDLNNVPEIIEFWDNILGRKFVEDVYTYDLDKMLGKFDGPVHVFHGDSDPVVDVEYSKKYIEKKYPNAKLDIMIGQGHGFTDDIRLQNITIIAKEIALD